MNCRVCLRRSATEVCKKCQPKLAAVASMDASEVEMLKKFPSLGKTTRHWILDEHGQPAPATLGQWAIMFEDRKRRIVKQEWIGDVRVSTVFMGLNLGIGSAVPILWETMAFSNKKSIDGDTLRCGGNREQAEAMHEKMCRHVAGLEKVPYRKTKFTHGKK